MKKTLALLFVLVCLIVWAKHESDQANQEAECRIAQQYANDGTLWNPKYDDSLHIQKYREVAQGCGIVEVTPLPTSTPTTLPTATQAATMQDPCEEIAQKYVVALGNQEKNEDIRQQFINCRKQYPAPITAEEADAAVEVIGDIWGGLMDGLSTPTATPPYSEACVMEKLAYVQHPEDPATRRTASECMDYWQGQAIGKYFESQ